MSELGLWELLEILKHFSTLVIMENNQGSSGA